MKDLLNQIVTFFFNLMVSFLAPSLLEGLKVARVNKQLYIHPKKVVVIILIIQAGLDIFRLGLMILGVLYLIH